MFTLWTIPNSPRPTKISPPLFLSLSKIECYDPALARGTYDSRFVLTGSRHDNSNDHHATRTATSSVFRANFVMVPWRQRSQHEYTKFPLFTKKMVVLDKRRSLIVSTAGHFFGVPLKDDETIADEQTVLDNFLDRAACRILCAQPADAKDEELRLKLSNELPVGRNTLVFFKVNKR